MYFKAVFDFYRPLGDKVPEALDILAKMSSDPLFSAPPVPYPDFDAALQALTESMSAAEFGGIERNAIKRSNEKIVDNILRQYKLYVSTVANGNTDIILASGFRHTKPRQAAGDMPKVTGLQGVSTTTSGQLKARWDQVDNSFFFEVDVRVATSQAPREESVPDTGTDTGAWETHTTKASSITIDGLKPLTYYEVRVRVNGSKGYGGYSDRIVLLVT